MNSVEQICQELREYNNLELKTLHHKNVVLDATFGFDTIYRLDLEDDIMSKFITDNEDIIQRYMGVLSINIDDIDTALCKEITRSILNIFDVETNNESIPQRVKKILEYFSYKYLLDLVRVVKQISCSNLNNKISSEFRTGIFEMINIIIHGLNRGIGFMISFLNYDISTSREEMQSSFEDSLSEFEEFYIPKKRMLNEEFQLMLDKIDRSYENGEMELDIVNKIFSIFFNSLDNIFNFLKNETVKIILASVVENEGILERRRIEMEENVEERRMWDTFYDYGRNLTENYTQSQNGSCEIYKYIIILIVFLLFLVYFMVY